MKLSYKSQFNHRPQKEIKDSIVLSEKPTRDLQYGISLWENLYRISDKSNQKTVFTKVNCRRKLSNAYLSLKFTWKIQIIMCSFIHTEITLKLFM